MPTANSSELTAFRVHPMQGDEIRALRRLQREQELSSHVFMTERDGPMTPKSFHGHQGAAVGIVPLIAWASPSREGQMAARARL